MTIDLATLFLTHSDGLRQSLTRQFGDPVLAADLVQDTFLRLAQTPGGQDNGDEDWVGSQGIGNMRSYLGRIARNLALNHFRQIRQRRTSVVDSEDLAGIADERPSAEAELDGRRRLHGLRTAIAELPERTRRVFTLTRMMGLTYPEAAQRLGISESSVQKHLSRALLHATAHAQ